MAKGGGAWKVAYADFITAMMALFMVLWILGSEQEILEHLQQYFRNPPSPFDQESGLYEIDLGEAEGRGDSKLQEKFFDRVDPSVLKSIVKEVYRILKTDQHLDHETVEIALVDDGLRMMIFDRRDTRLFQDGSDELTPWGTFLVQNLAWILVRYDFSVVVEGYGSPEEETASQEQDYGSWELSADRANAMRRALSFYSGGDLKFERVVGHGLAAVTDAAGKDRHQRISLSLSLNSARREVVHLTE